MLITPRVCLLTQSCFDPGVGHSLALRTKSVLWELSFDITMKRPAESGRPEYRCSSPWTSGDLNSTGGRIAINHHNACCETVEPLLKTIAAVNRLSSYGAVTKWYNNQELPLTPEPRKED